MQSKRFLLFASISRHPRNEKEHGDSSFFGRATWGLL